MARRVPLPRLTQRQRSARWQRERRQQTVYVVAFSAVLFFVLGLAAWAATDRYHTANLKTAGLYDGNVIPYRDFQRELRFQLVSFYASYGIPKESENDPNIAAQKAQYESFSLSSVMEQAALDTASREESVTVSPQAIDDKYRADLSQFRSRHILITPEAAATDKEVADKTALAKATAIVNELRAAPMDQDLWNRVAKEKSEDPGSKESGGDLGFVGKGQFVAAFEDAAAKLEIGQISDPVKSDFGYHVIQVLERRAPEDNDLVKRYLASGFTVADIKEHIKYDLLRTAFTERAKAAAVQSPTAQIRIAHILINTPQPTGGDFEAFTAGLKKLSDVQQALDGGKDFGEVAKQFSDDTATAESGGDLGWHIRGMLGDLVAEDELFKLDAGARSRPFSGRTQSVIYKVVEKAASREVTEEQKKKVQDNAYQVWLQRQEQAHGARRLVPGLEFE